jgi:16S rRNA (guanine527-N7)-methyltransferase
VNETTKQSAPERPAGAALAKLPLMRKSRVGPDSDPAATDELLERFGLLGTASAEPLRILIAEVLKDDIPEKYGREIGHVIEDSLYGLSINSVAEATRAADVGSGYGFPGLALAAAMPRATWTLVEFDPVRSAFLDRTMKLMGITNADVINWPVENWRDGIGQHDLVTARNVAALSTMVEWAAPLLKVGGTAMIWARARDEVEEADAGAAAAATGLTLIEVIQASPDLKSKGGEKRHIHVLRKDAETPAEFPRPRKAALREPIRADGGPARTRWDDAVRKREFVEAKQRAAEEHGRRVAAKKARHTERSPKDGPEPGEEPETSEGPGPTSSRTRGQGWLASISRRLK